jgi:hypothetical protein
LGSLPSGIKIIDYKPQEEPVGRLASGWIRKGSPMVVPIRARRPPTMQTEQYFAIVAQNLIEDFTARVRLSTA